MKKIREVLRLKSTTDLSDRQIAGALSISRPVVEKYWKAFIRSNLQYDQIGEIADSTLIEALEKPQNETSERLPGTEQTLRIFRTGAASYRGDTAVALGRIQGAPL